MHRSDHAIAAVPYQREGCILEKTCRKILTNGLEVKCSCRTRSDWGSVINQLASEDKDAAVTFVF